MRTFSLSLFFCACLLAYVVYALSILHHMCAVSFIFLCPQLNMLPEGVEWCGKALEQDKLHIDVLCDRAELYIQNSMFEEAISDFQKAKTVENHPKKV